VPTTVTIPALPTSIRNITIRRRTGWFTTASDSLVVKPAPDSAERAWKRADSRDRPVSARATVATRVISSERITATNTLVSASTSSPFPARSRADTCPAPWAERGLRRGDGGSAEGVRRAAIAFERVRSTFWALPAACMALAIAAAFVLPAVDESIQLPDAVSFSGGPDTARAVLQMIATVAVSVAGISFSVIVVALVLASQQLSPRVLRSFQRHPLNQVVLGVFLGTAAYSLYVLLSLEDGADEVPEAAVTVAAVLAAVSLMLFVVFLHHVVRSLNASAVIRRIAADGHQAIHRPYPDAVGEPPEDERAADEAIRELTSRAAPREVRAPRAGYVASVKGYALLAAAEECEGFVEQRVPIGDFCVTGAVLALVWVEPPRREELVRRVEAAFVLNEERLVDHDVAFPVRQLADVALKGLSPSVNDPTTAENAMDSVTDSLVRVACRPTPALVRADGLGRPRFRACVPSLDALVRLGYDQARRDGAARPSFSVRLLELLADLREMGGERAARCAEIDRQAALVRDHATALAEVSGDEELVREAYERLHAGRPERADLHGAVAAARDHARGG
jgi:uncharacterized membrane protein